jgi:hypothetical protein
VNSKRWLILKVIFAGFVIMLVTRSVWPGAGQPTYQGRSLDYWFKEYCRSSMYLNWDPAREKHADVVLQKIGSNAVPYLVAATFARSPTSPFEQFAFETLALAGPAAKETLPVLRDAMRTLPRDRTREAAESAIEAIEAIEAQPGNAVP